MAYSLICSDPSGRSCQKSNCEWIAQVAHDKRATVSDLLRVLMRKEQMSQSLFFIENCSFALSLKKKSNLQKKMWLSSDFLVRFLYVFLQVFFKEQFAYSLFFNERCERIAQVAH